MAIVQRNIQIKASPQEVMALLSDASRWPDWYPGMTEIDIAAPFPEEGGKVAFKVKSAGVSMLITETVLDYQPEKLQLLKMDGILSGHARWELSPEGDGTRLTTTFDYALPGGVFGKIADALGRFVDIGNVHDEKPGRGPLAQIGDGALDAAGPEIGGLNTQIVQCLAHNAFGIAILDIDHGERRGLCYGEARLGGCVVGIVVAHCPVAPLPAPLPWSRMAEPVVPDPEEVFVLPAL